jgi:hypothetical protein
MQARRASERHREATRELITRARSDRHVFGEVYDYYVTRVFAFCHMCTLTLEEAEDLTAHIRFTCTAPPGGPEPLSR